MQIDALGRAAAEFISKNNAKFLIIAQPPVYSIILQYANIAHSRCRAAVNSSALAIGVGITVNALLKVLYVCMPK